MQLILQLSFLVIILTQLSEAVVVSELCKNRKFGYKVQDPEDCHEYFLCLGAMGQFNLDCGRDYRFSEAEQKCVRGKCPPYQFLLTDIIGKPSSLEHPSVGQKANSNDVIDQAVADENGVNSPVTVVVTAEDAISNFDNGESTVPLYGGSEEPISDFLNMDTVGTDVISDISTSIPVESHDSTTPSTTTEDPGEYTSTTPSNDTTVDTEVTSDVSTSVADDSSAPSTTTHNIEEHTTTVSEYSTTPLPSTDEFTVSTAITKNLPRLLSKSSFPNDSSTLLDSTTPSTSTEVPGEYTSTTPPNDTTYTFGTAVTSDVSTSIPDDSHDSTTPSTTTQDIGEVTSTTPSNDTTHTDAIVNSQPVAAGSEYSTTLLSSTDDFKVSAPKVKTFRKLLAKSSSPNDSSTLHDSTTSSSTTESPGEYTSTTLVGDTSVTSEVSTSLPDDSHDSTTTSTTTESPGEHTSTTPLNDTTYSVNTEVTTGVSTTLIPEDSQDSTTPSTTTQDIEEFTSTTPYNDPTHNDVIIHSPSVTAVSQYSTPLLSSTKDFTVSNRISKSFPKLLPKSSSTYDPSTLCKTISSGDFIRDPTDCTKYFTCYKSVAYFQQCPGGLYFDQVTKICKDPDLVDCQLNTEDISSPMPSTTSESPMQPIQTTSAIQGVTTTEQTTGATTITSTKIEIHTVLPTHTSSDPPIETSTELPTQTITQEPPTQTAAGTTKVITTVTPEQSSTVVPNEISTELPTETSTAATTETPPEVPTQSTTVTAITTITEILTQTSTKATTEVATELPTQVSTVTQTLTVAPIETTTESLTETSTSTDLVTDVPTENPTQTSTVTTIESVTELPTTTSTEPITETSTTIPTKPSTVTPTQISTELPPQIFTVVTTIASTDDTTQTMTEITTEIPTQTTTDPSTETHTELPTETCTEAITETPCPHNRPGFPGGIPQSSYDYYESSEWDIEPSESAFEPQLSYEYYDEPVFDNEPSASVFKRQSSYDYYEPSVSYMESSESVFEPQPSYEYYDELMSDIEPSASAHEPQSANSNYEPLVADNENSFLDIEIPDLDFESQLSYNYDEPPGLDIESAESDLEPQSLSDYSDLALESQPANDYYELSVPDNESSDADLRPLPQDIKPLASNCHQGRRVPEDCQHLASGTFLRDAVDCGKYYVCQNGNPVTLQCSSGQYFDDEKFVCNFKNLVTNCPT